MLLSLTSAPGFNVRAVAQHKADRKAPYFTLGLGLAATFAEFLASLLA